MGALLSKLRNLHTTLFIFIMVGIKLINAIFFGFLSLQVRGKAIDQGIFNFKSWWDAFFVACVIAPLLETALFQHFLFKQLKKFSLNHVWMVVISGLLFGIAHSYHTLYVINAFFGGMILMSCYILRIGKQPFLVTSAIHAVYNLMVLLLNAL